MPAELDKPSPGTVHYSFSQWFTSNYNMQVLWMVSEYLPEVCFLKYSTAQNF
jgi:hypothetical protein